MSTKALLHLPSISCISLADTIDSRALGSHGTFCLLAVGGNRRSRSVSFMMMAFAAVLQVLLAQSADFLLVVGDVAVVVDVSKTRC